MAETVPYDIDEIARNSVGMIEDLFCKHFDGGVRQRRAAIQVVLIEAMQKLWDRRVATLPHTVPKETY